MKNFSFAIDSIWPSEDGTDFNATLYAWDGMCWIDTEIIAGVTNWAFSVKIDNDFDGLADCPAWGENAFQQYLDELHEANQSWGVFKDGKCLASCHDEATAASVQEGLYTIGQTGTIIMKIKQP